MSAAPKRLLLSVLLAVSAHAFAADKPAASPPAMFRGNAAHTGVYAAAAAPGITDVAWKFKTDGRVISSPVVAGDTVYVGSTDRKLYALNRQDGTLRWKFATKGAVNSSPAVADGLVYFASLDGNFYAVEATTGKEKWKFATGGERRYTAPGIHGLQPRTERMPDPFDVFLSSPAVAHGVVYFGSGDHHVYALDAKSGQLKWKFTTGDVVHASPAVADGVVYIGSWDRHLYALDALTGKMQWRFETGNDTEIYNQIGIASSAAVMDGTVFFGCRDGHFYALDAKTGNEKWKHNNKRGWVIASPAVLDGKVYFPTSDGTRFKALAAATGQLVFDLANKAVSFSSPAIAQGIAYFGSSDGWLHAVDLTAGAVVARFQTEGSRQNSAKYLDAEGKLNNAALYPDSTLDGVIIGLDRMFSLGSILSSPVVADGVVYVGSTDGHLYALRGPSAG